MKKLIRKMRSRKDEPPSSQLAERTFSYFYSPQNKQFQARTESKDTLGEQDHYGYVVWPVIITVHALAETLPESKQLLDAITCLQAYWNAERYGFCAWKMYEGNADIYYDDNAHACQALITVYQATSDKKCLAQANDILTKLIMPSALKDGGVPWHINNPNARNACSTGPAAVAALRLCAIEHDQSLFDFAERALCWMTKTLQDPRDGLIWDSLIFENGKPNINKMKWTYNTGFAIHGFTLLYELTNKEGYLDTACGLTRAALNRNCSLFDHCIQDEKERMYSDGSYFVHHLVDGFIVLSRHEHSHRLPLHQEIHRIAAWVSTKFLEAPYPSIHYRSRSEI